MAEDEGRKRKASGSHKKGTRVRTGEGTERLQKQLQAVREEERRVKAEEVAAAVAAGQAAVVAAEAAGQRRLEEAVAAERRRSEAAVAEQRRRAEAAEAALAKERRWAERRGYIHWAFDSESEE